MKEVEIGVGVVVEVWGVAGVVRAPLVGKIEVVVVDLAFGELGRSFVSTVLVDLRELVVFEIAVLLEVTGVFEEFLGVGEKRIEVFGFSETSDVVETINDALSPFEKPLGAAKSLQRGHWATQRRSVNASPQVAMSREARVRSARRVDSPQTGHRPLEGIGVARG